MRTKFCGKNIEQVATVLVAKGSIGARGLRVNSFYYPTRPVAKRLLPDPTRPAGIPVIRSTRSRPTKIFGLKINEYIQRDS